MTPAARVAEAAAALARGRLLDEWRGTAAYAALLARPAAAGFAAHPRDARPPPQGAPGEAPDATPWGALLAGRFRLAGAVLDVGPNGDPWTRASPSRRFAVELHRFAWLPALENGGLDGALEALRLVRAWNDAFPRPAPFAWGAEVLERRTYNLACAARWLSAAASEAETAGLADLLARSARHLLRVDGGSARRAERLAAAALAGAALAGPAGEALSRAALGRLGPALDEAVLADGGLRTRAPEQALNLRLDLATLDDALLQRGRAAPEALPRAADRLAGAVRTTALGDGRPAAFNGGGRSTPARAEAARALDGSDGSAFAHQPHSGYQRLAGRRLRVLVDAGPPPEGGWSVAACAQPLALEASCGRERLIVNGGWTPDAAAPAALRLTAAGSTLTLEEGSCGRPLTGRLARALGARLVDGARRVEARRSEADGGVWLDLAHDGWVARDGLLHQRRLFLDPQTDELRGEDVLTPALDVRAPEGLRGWAVRFHLAPEVEAQAARDGRSLVFRTRTDGTWRLRHDAAEAALEPSAVVEGGLARRTLQAVLRGRTDRAGRARVRWKLAPVEPPRPADPPEPPAP